MYELRNYQKEASDAGVRFFMSDTKGNGVIVVPTGGGKSLILADIAYRLDAPVLIFQPNKEILEQNLARLMSYGVMGVGVYSASLKQKFISRITFATIGSVMKNKELFKKFKYIMIDECHLVNAEEGMYKTFFESLGKDIKILGFTATPYRLSTSLQFGSMLKFITRTRVRVFTRVLYIVQVSTLSKSGFLAPLNYYRVDTIDTSKLTINQNGSDYTDWSVKAHYKAVKFGDKLLDVTRRLLNVGRESILVFTRFIEEAEWLANNIEGAAVVSQKSTPSERKSILERFKAGKIKVVANVGILTTGFDFPSLSTVVIARPTMSLALYYQIVGRAIRPYKGQTKWIVDLCDNLSRFGKVEDLEIREPREGMYAVFSGHRQLTNVYFNNAVTHRHQLNNVNYR